MKNMLIKAFEYKTWADIRTLDAIEEIDNKRFGDAYGFALQQLNHMAIVEELFRSRLENTPPTHTSTNTDTVPGFNVLKQGLKDSNVWYLGYALSEYLPTC